MVGECGGRETRGKTAGKTRSRMSVGETRWPGGCREMVRQRHRVGGRQRKGRVGRSVHALAEKDVRAGVAGHAPVIAPKRRVGVPGDEPGRGGGLGVHVEAEGGHRMVLVSMSRSRRYQDRLRSGWRAGHWRLRGHRGALPVHPSRWRLAPRPRPRRCTKRSVFVWERVRGGARRDVKDIVRRTVRGGGIGIERIVGRGDMGRRGTVCNHCGQLFSEVEGTGLLAGIDVRVGEVHAGRGPKPCLAQ